MSNTCPLDNFLAILWSTFLCYPPVRQMFAEDSSAVSACLCKAVNLINEGKDAEAKVLGGEVLNLVPRQRVLDMHGNQHERFAGKYSEAWMRTVLRATCQCCGHTLVRHSCGATLSLCDSAISAAGSTKLLKMVDHWLCPPPTGSKCPHCNNTFSGSKRFLHSLPPILLLEVPPEVSAVVQMSA